MHSVWWSSILVDIPSVRVIVACPCKLPLRLGLRPCLACSRASASSTRLLDDILRFGSPAIFAQVPALPSQAAQDAAAPEAPSQLRAAQPAHYTDAVLDVLVARTAPGALGSQRAQEGAGEQQPGAAGPSFSLGSELEGLTVKEWGPDLQDPAAPSDDLGEHGTF